MTKSRKVRTDTNAGRAKRPSASKSAADRILPLLRRRNGASLEELARATGWQPHSVRGYLSGTVRKRLGLPLVSERDAKGARRYFLREASK